MMRGLDLFSGIGGLTLALSDWVRPVAYCECDRYAQGVLMSRMADGSLPRAPIWDDVRTLRGSLLPGPIDIVYGGFPCQDISVAGRGAGLAGERSGLFFEIARLIGELRPTFVFLENSPRIVDRGGVELVRSFTRLRYDCRWGVLSAFDMGASHRRPRWWCLAMANPLPERRSELGASHDNDRNYEDGYKPYGRNQIQTWDAESGHQPGLDGMAARIPRRTYRVGAIGNSVVPACAKEAFIRLGGLA